MRLAAAWSAQASATGQGTGAYRVVHGRQSRRACVNAPFSCHVRRVNDAPLARGRRGWVGYCASRTTKGPAGARPTRSFLEMPKHKSGGDAAGTAVADTPGPKPSKAERAAAKAERAAAKAEAAQPRRRPPRPPRPRRSGSRRSPSSRSSWPPRRSSRPPSTPSSPPSGPTSPPPEGPRARGLAPRPPRPRSQPRAADDGARAQRRPPRRRPPSGRQPSGAGHARRPRDRLDDRPARRPANAQSAADSCACCQPEALASVAGPVILEACRPPEVIAAVDIGSNSAHLLVALVDDRTVTSLADESALLGLGGIVDRRGTPALRGADRARRRTRRLRHHRPALARQRVAAAGRGAVPAGRRCR